MTSITQGAIQGSSEIAGQLGVSNKLTHKLGGVGVLLGATSKVGKFVNRIRGDKGEQRPPLSTRQSTPGNVQSPQKPGTISKRDQAEQRPPLATRQSIPTNLQRPQKPAITSNIDQAEQRPPLPTRRSTFGNEQRPQKPGTTSNID